VRVERARGEETARAEFALAEDVAPPPGPGSQLLFGALPLRAGYSATFYQFTPTFHFLEREPDPAIHGVRARRLSVVGRETLRTPAGEFDAWVVVVEPADRGEGAVSKHWVRAAPPHYALRTEYTPAPGRTVASEVTGILLPASPPIR
jgi:hypothetical protein